MDNPYHPMQALPTNSPSFGLPRWADTTIRLLIMLICSSQYLGLMYNLVSGWDYLSFDPEAGGLSPIGIGVSLVFALILLLAGVLTFFGRKLAVFAFLAYLPNQLYWVATAESTFLRVTGLISLVTVGLFLLYAKRLERFGMLR